MYRPTIRCTYSVFRNVVFQSSQGLPVHPSHLLTCADYIQTLAKRMYPTYLENQQRNQVKMVLISNANSMLSVSKVHPKTYISQTLSMQWFLCPKLIQWLQNPKLIQKFIYPKLIQWFLRPKLIQDTAVVQIISIFPNGLPNMAIPKPVLFRIKHQGSLSLLPKPII